MKFAPDVLLEIMNAFQEGLVTGTDISQRLRDIDVDVRMPNPGDELDLSTATVALSPGFLARRGGKNG